ncbi:PhnD/SsuA/transferrin family substrate-binding protein [Variovorax sp. PAMC28562]|uniref:rhodanese-like domain-containing protein n=1 Tax=Variovorax sp. PAMC28562 TaxID=2762323 RepID=UPI00164D7356|nr:rhodanese-like domain-containing protein [Variovorax sp. PAMC28562]QNK73823.1 PhnD/SsuA/transferrin family substrate-binding protein [Variovorax sp. PAMC28562]
MTKEFVRCGVSPSRWLRPLGVVAGLLLSLAAHAQVKILVNPGDQGEQSRGATMTSWRTAIEQVLRKERFNDSTMAGLADMTSDLSATRARIPDVVVGPAHLIGSALRYGYTPVAQLDVRSQAVLVVSTHSPITNFQQAAGKRLGLPMQDSLVTYLLRGETVAANTTIKRHFRDLYETRYQDALLVCLQIGRCDVVGVEKATYEKWIAAGSQVKVIMESREVPGLSLAIKDGSKISADAFRADLAEVAAAGSKTTRVSPQDFTYVSTLGYFTPRALAGAKVVDAKTVAAMLSAHTARYIDTRNDAEFNEGHVPGSVLVPYVEKSAKDPDFTSDADQFNIAKLGPERDAVLVFGCNGPECWKSHKASIAALKAGYKNVNWFRGGLPEWRAAGLAVDTNAK